MHWRLVLEEYGPELIYVQGSKNIAANTLSRLDKVGTFNIQQVMRWRLILKEYSPELSRKCSKQVHIFT